MTNPTIPHGTEEQDMSEELKPCPFCNQPARQEKQRPGPNGERRGTVTGCFNLLCKIMPLKRHEDDQSEAAIAAWNQRAKPRVKALEFFKWKRAGGGYHEGQLSANTQAGNYAIMHHESKGLYYLVCPDSTEYYDTLDKAAAAAQVDFTRRVHACLEGYDD